MSKRYHVVAVETSHACSSYDSTAEAFAEAGRLAYRLCSTKTGLHLPDGPMTPDTPAFFYRYGGGQGMASKLARAVVFITKLEESN